jgi:hypothetical protein
MVDTFKIYRFAQAFEGATDPVDQVISGLWDGNPPGDVSSGRVSSIPSASNIQRSGFSVPGYSRVTETPNKELQQKAQELLPQVRTMPYGQGIPFTDSQGQQYLAVHEEHSPGGTHSDYHSGVSLFKPNTPLVTSGPVQLSARSEKMISELNPQFQPQVRKLLLQGLAEGLRPEIVEAFRTQSRQDELYEKGGVTQTRKSMHTGTGQPGTALAVDIAQLDPKGQITYNATPGFWERMGEIGQSLGMTWGGSWKGFQDKPHFQYKS